MKMSYFVQNQVLSEDNKHIFSHVITAQELFINITNEQIFDKSASHVNYQCLREIINITITKFPPSPNSAFICCHVMKDMLLLLLFDIGVDYWIIAFFCSANQWVFCTFKCVCSVWFLTNATSTATGTAATDCTVMGAVIGTATSCISHAVIGCTMTGHTMMGTVIETVTSAATGCTATGTVTGHTGTDPMTGINITRHGFLGRKK